MMRSLFFCLVFAVVYISCNSGDPKQQYSKLVRSERAKGNRVDSLFLGIYFGMPNKEFYAHCWEMNKKGIVMDGVNNVFVLYRLNNGELKYPGAMNFYPEFFEGKVCLMKTEFTYDGWAPWNKKESADSLLPDVLNFFKEWYPEGNPFITIPDSSRGTLHVKIDGNRRIVIKKADERIVKAEFTDIMVEDKLRKVKPE